MKGQSIEQRGDRLQFKILPRLEYDGKEPCIVKTQDDQLLGILNDHANCLATDCQTTVGLIQWTRYKQGMWHKEIFQELAYSES